MAIEFHDPSKYSLNQPIHVAVYGYNGAGKTTFAGTTGLRTILLDCRDAGAVTLRDVDPKLLRIVKVPNPKRYLEIVEEINRMDDYDLLVVDTLSGLQAEAIREIKGKNQDMNQRKWGQVSSRIIECISETRNCPKDVLYLIQERRKSVSGEDENSDRISPNLTPSIKGYLSSAVDWVGWLGVGELEEDKDGNMVAKRVLDFRISDELEAKDRAGAFPKQIKNPKYLTVRKRIISHLKGEVTNAGTKQNKTDKG